MRIINMWRNTTKDISVNEFPIMIIPKLPLWLLGDFGLSISGAQSASPIRGKYYMCMHDCFSLNCMGRVNHPYILCLDRKNYFHKVELYVAQLNRYPMPVVRVMPL